MTDAKRTFLASQVPTAIWATPSCGPSQRPLAPCVKPCSRGSRNSPPSGGGAGFLARGPRSTRRPAQDHPDLPVIATGRTVYAAPLGTCRQMKVTLPASFLRSSASRLRDDLGVWLCRWSHGALAVASATTTLACTMPQPTTGVPRPTAHTTALLPSTATTCAPGGAVIARPAELVQDTLLLVTNRRRRAAASSAGMEGTSLFTTRRGVPSHYRVLVRYSEAFRPNYYADMKAPLC